MPSTLLRKPVIVGALAGGLTAVAVFGGTGAFIAAAQDSSDTTTVAPDTTAPDTTAPDTTAPDTTAPDTTAPDNSSPDTTAPSPDDQQAQIDQWKQCMADHGVTLPEPPQANSESGATFQRHMRPGRPLLDSADRDTVKAAIDACGPPPGGRMHHPGGAGCPGMGGPGGTAPNDDGSTTPAPNDTAPSAQGSSYRV
jgi:hypothetical protein